MFMNIKEVESACKNKKIMAFIDKSEWLYDNMPASWRADKSKAKAFLAEYIDSMFLETYCTNFYDAEFSKNCKLIDKTIETILNNDDVAKRCYRILREVTGGCLKDCTFEELEEATEEYEDEDNPYVARRSRA